MRNVCLPRSRVSIALVSIAIGIVGSPQAVSSQAPAPCRRATALGAPELLDALGSGAPSGAVARLVTSCGTSFTLNPELEQRFRARGADDVLFAAIRTMSPPAGAPDTRWISPLDGLEMGWVVAGSFQMGSPLSEPGRDGDEAEHRQVIANGMWVDVVEVSYEAFRRFVVAVPAWQRGGPSPELADSNYLSDWNGISYPSGRDKEPVRWVSWHAARAYAAWAGKRLATEAEWEYVARAGTTGRYWWGEAFDPAHLHPGSADLRSRRSPWGLQDLLGSLWEWTSSAYEPYPYDAGRAEREGAGRRVIRGGAVNSGEQFVRAANRNSDLPVLTSELIGFRCVR